MERKQKLIISGLAGTMVLGATTGAALAYLTDGETAENTFTIGDISIEGIEPNYPGNDSDDVKDIVPNEEVNKDPQVDNNGVNDAIVFMTVDSPMEFITVVKDNGEILEEKAVNELFWFKDKEDPQSAHANNFDDGWQNLPGKEMYVKIAADGVETKLIETSQEALKAAYDALQPGEKLVKRHVFGYKQPIQGSTIHDGSAQSAENKVTTPLFDKVQLKNVIENEIDEAVEKIVVRSYAIQSTKILENSVDLATNLNEANLGKIYDIFVRQNSEGNDASGTKLNEARDIDLLTPTNNGASGTTDAHKNRFGTDSDVSSPNNVNSDTPAVPDQGETDDISGIWYHSEAEHVAKMVLNKDGTYAVYEYGMLSDKGTYSVESGVINFTGARPKQNSYSLSDDKSTLTINDIAFTKTNPDGEAADLTEHAGEYTVKKCASPDGTSCSTLRIKIAADGTVKEGSVSDGMLFWNEDGEPSNYFLKDDVLSTRDRTGVKALSKQPDGTFMTVTVIDNDNEHQFYAVSGETVGKIEDAIDKRLCTEPDGSYAGRSTKLKDGDVFYVSGR